MLTAVVRSPALRLLRHRAPRGWSRRTAIAHLAASSGRSIEGETAAGASDSGYAAAREAQAARLHRFYVDDPLPSSGGTFHLGREESRHATKALRLKPGDRLEVCDGAGGLVVAELVGVEGSGRDGGVAAVAAVGEVRRVPFAGPKWDVAVACGSLKGGRADWLVEKCSELGASSLVPLLTERSGSVGGSGSSSSSGNKRGKGKGKGRDRGDRGDDRGDRGGDELTGREGRWESEINTLQTFGSYVLLCRPTWPNVPSGLETFAIQASRQRVATAKGSLFRRVCWACRELGQRDCNRHPVIGTRPPGA